MVFLDVALLALLLGALLGGSLGRLAEATVRASWLAFAAIALQVAAFPSGVLPWSMPSQLARGLWVGSYLLLFAFLAANRRLTGLPVVAAGAACNLLAVLANGGLMPVRPAALRAAGRSYQIHNNSIDLVRPHLAWLVDRFAAPRWLPFANVFSVGDVLIAIGIMLAILAAMGATLGPPRLRRIPLRALASPERD